MRLFSLLRPSLSSLTFLVHPSRAPVAENNAISGVALTFDEFHNLVLKPASVQFQLSAKGSDLMSHGRDPRWHCLVPHQLRKISWSAANHGLLAKDVTTRRVVQEVASDPCNLRIKGERTPKGIVVETDPVRDCSGNPVPDGTMVTFTAKTGGEMSSVDAPVKQDVARATNLANGPVSFRQRLAWRWEMRLRLGGQ